MEDLLAATPEKRNEMGTQQVNAEELNRLLKVLDGKITRLETELAAVREENQELRSQLAGSPASGPAPTESLAATITQLLNKSEKKARVPKPHDYDGDRQKLPTYIMDQGLDREADTEKAINIIAGYMTGTAAAWYTTAYLTKVQNENFWGSREDFWRDVKARFGDSDPTFSARTRLSRLKQGSNSVQSYSSKFNELALQTGYNDEALVQEYFRGLAEDILQGVFRRDTIPDTLEKAIAAATREENAKYMFASFLGGREKTSPYTKGKTAATANSAASGSNTKAANNTGGKGGTSTTPRPGTTGPMDVDRARRAGECWHCGDPYMPGHFCPAKKAAQDAYKTRVRLTDTQQAESEPEASSSREVTLSKDAKGKGKEKAPPSDQDIGGALATMMDMINILGKRIDSLNG